MNGIRCAISLDEVIVTTMDGDKRNIGAFVSYWNTAHHKSFTRIFGSHSEAKRELEKWLPEWTDARIVDEVEL